MRRALAIPPHPWGHGICHVTRATGLDEYGQQLAGASPLGPSFGHNEPWWDGTVDPLSIAYGSHALGLGPANPTRTYLASEPSGYRRPGFPPGFSLLMPASALPRGPPGVPPGLRPPRDAPLPKDPKVQSAASAAGLAPVHCRRTRTRPVSYYALFQGWLLLSQPPGCLRAKTSFPT